MGYYFVMGKIIIALLVLIIGAISFFLLREEKKQTVSNTPNERSNILPTNTTDIPRMTVITEGLEVPWGIAFMPDNRMLVTERGGTVKIINLDGTVAATSIATIPVNVASDGEGGLLGIAVHPDFEKNQFVYLYYTYNSTGNSTLNRVIRMKFESEKLSDQQIIVDAIPGALYHNGGRIKFGPDKNLYITTGDAQDPDSAQSASSLAGKILRVTDDGKAVNGNPFGNLVYSYGHRNPQGIAWNDAGQLWETEHGRSNPTGFDEVNYIESGKNYGWEVIQGDEGSGSMETPKVHSGSSGVWAPGSAAFIGDSLFFGGLRGEAMYEAVIGSNDVVELKEHFKGEFGRIREVVVGPDNMLYITTSNRDGRGRSQAGDDRIIRINPERL